ncbi:sel1 repeat family protein [Inquilinus limosus]|uniref:tetratricopeptide repeat protein n=1 Tax=Inquilinus limosus TaxID=171674 RepID=UPI003F169A6D
MSYGYLSIPIDHTWIIARSVASGRNFAVLLILAGIGWFAAEGLGARQGEAAPLLVTEEAQLEGGIIVAPTDNPTTQVPMPDSASAGSQAIGRDAIAAQADAEHDLGPIWALGREVPQNFESAAYWYRRAPDQGGINANYDLGVLLELGLGVPRDRAAAVARFRKAADAGQADAQNVFGLAYLRGSGVERDPEEALNWFRRASVGGNSSNAYNAGGLNEDRELGASDWRAATDWYRIAADAGDGAAVGGAAGGAARSRSVGCLELKALISIARRGDGNRPRLRTAARPRA